MTEQVVSSPSVSEPKPFSPPSERENEDEDDGSVSQYIEGAVVSSCVIAVGGAMAYPATGNANVLRGGTSYSSFTTDHVAPVRIIDTNEAEYAVESISPYRVVEDHSVEHRDFEAFLDWSPTPKPKHQLSASVERTERRQMEWDF